MNLTIAGRAAIFVNGDFNAQNSLTLTLADGAQLDLFISGNLLLGDATLGAVGLAREGARVRRRSDAHARPAPRTIGANIYAPNANVALASEPRDGGLALRRLAPALRRVHDPLRRVDPLDHRLRAERRLVPNVPRLRGRDAGVHRRNMRGMPDRRRLLRAAPLQPGALLRRDSLARVWPVREAAVRWREVPAVSGAATHDWPKRLARLSVRTGAWARAEREPVARRRAGPFRAATAATAAFSPQDSTRRCLRTRPSSCSLPPPPRSRCP